MVQYTRCSVVCSDVMQRQCYTIRAASELTHQSLCLPVLVCSLSVSRFDCVFLRQPWLSLWLQTKRWMNLAGPSLCLFFPLFSSWLAFIELPWFALINLIINLWAAQSFLVQTLKYSAWTPLLLEYIIAIRLKRAYCMYMWCTTVFTWCSSSV